MAFSCLPSAFSCLPECSLSALRKHAFSCLPECSLSALRKHAQKSQFLQRECKILTD